MNIESINAEKPSETDLVDITSEIMNSNDLFKETIKKEMELIEINHNLVHIVQDNILYLTNNEPYKLHLAIEAIQETINEDQLVTNELKHALIGMLFLDITDEDF